MGIAFDLTYRLGSNKDRGIGRYVNNILRNIGPNEDNNYHFFQPNSYKYYNTELKQFIRKHKITDFVLTSFFDLYTNNVFLDKNVLEEVNLHVIIYDLIPMIYPNIYLGNPHTKNKYLATIAVIKKASNFFSISSHTKEDIKKYLAVNPSQITTIGGGVGSEFTQKTPINPNIKRKFNIRSPYVLCVGGSDFRKNLTNLVKAFKKVSDTLEKKLTLVITCKIDDATKRKLNRLKKSLTIRSEIILTGYVSDEDLVDLYKQALMFIFPSLYEGLGLVILEAMACGTPVITSTNSALKTFCDQHLALGVNPLNIHDIAKKIILLYKNEDMRKRLKLNGLKFSKNQHWEKVTRRLLDVIDKQQ